MTATAFIGVGANLGDAKTTVTDATLVLSETQGILSCEVARLYGSKPVDADGPDFVNTVVKLTTDLSPIALLDTLQRIENQFGRQRSHLNAPRTLDLDLLDYEGIEINTDRLVLPHPRMHVRAFVLQPLFDLAPDLLLKQGSILGLLEVAKQQQSVWLIGKT